MYVSKKIGYTKFRPTDSYTVVYCTGGTTDCKWRKIFTPFSTLAEAENQQFDLNRSGYGCMIFITRELNSIGMPEGWRADLLPKNMKIVSA
jgi:hypothetical protein